jgi:hypothetical protein
VTKLKTVQHGELALLFCAFTFLFLYGGISMFFLGFLFASNFALRFGFPFLLPFSVLLRHDFMFLWGRSGLLVLVLFWFGLRLFLVLLFGNGVCMYGTLDGQNGFFVHSRGLRVYEFTTIRRLRSYDVTKLRYPRRYEFSCLFFLLRFIYILLYLGFFLSLSLLFEGLRHYSCTLTANIFLCYLLSLLQTHFFEGVDLPVLYCYNHVGSSPSVHPGGGSVVDYFMGLTELTTSVTGFFCYIFFVYLLCSQIDS